jgi:prepilin-type processing-associated H-X9-DG protein
MKNVLVGFAIVILIACVVLLFLKHQAQEKSRLENKPLTQQSANLKLNIAKQSALAFFMFADDNQQQFPTNFTQAAPYLNGMVQWGTNFEIVYQGSRTNIAHPSGTIVFKEKQAWQTPDGKWMKTYGFADGHAEVQSEPNGNFNNFEIQHTLMPTPNQ